MKELVLWSLRLTREQTMDLVADIPVHLGCAQAVPGEHHAVWTLGHLILADSYLLTLLGDGRLPADFERLVALFGPGAEATPAAERYDSLPALRQRLADLGDERQRAIAARSEAALAQATPDPVLVRAQPTLAHHLHALVYHEGHHAGVLTAWRRTHGLAAVHWTFARPSAKATSLEGSITDG